MLFRSCGGATSFSIALASRLELERALGLVYDLKLAETFERDGERSAETNGGSMLLATQSAGLRANSANALGTRVLSSSPLVYRESLRVSSTGRGVRLKPKLEFGVIALLAGFICSGINRPIKTNMHCSIGSIAFLQALDGLITQPPEVRT